VDHKLVSVFEPHTPVIRKGKKAKPTEFGNLITIQEAEHQISTPGPETEARPADRLAPSISGHRTIRTFSDLR
jgi:IS5 family transposase